MAASVAVRRALRVEQGSHFREVLPSPIGDDGLPIDVTGWIGHGEIRDRPDSATVLHTWTPDLIACAGLTVTVSIPQGISRSWAWRTAVYQIEVSPQVGAPETFRVAQGVVVVVPWPLGQTGNAGVGYGFGGYGTGYYGG